MARSDLLLDLVDAGHRADRSRFQAVVEALIAEERANQHHLLADRLSQLTSSRGQQRDELARSVADLVEDRIPQHSLPDLLLPTNVQRQVEEFLEENRRSELLRSFGMEPRTRLLLEGPPGNGKTTLADAIANELMLPLYSMRYSGVISSFLGETAARLERAFEFARSRRCVLLIDEFDSIAKERSDIHETGEIKRVVSALLLEIDRLPAHVILIAATNHSEMLDSAAARRFDARLELPRPNRVQRQRYLEQSSQILAGCGLSSKTLSEHLDGASFSDLEQFVSSVRRRQILEQPHPNVRKIVRNLLQDRRGVDLDVER